MSVVSPSDWRVGERRSCLTLSSGRIGEPCELDTVLDPAEGTVSWPRLNSWLWMELCKTDWTWLGIEDVTGFRGKRSMSWASVVPKTAASVTKGLSVWEKYGDEMGFWIGT